VPGDDRVLGLVEDLVLLEPNQLDLLAGLLLEGGDDLGDRLVLLWVKTLLSPDDKVCGVCRQRRCGERRGENNGLPPHICLPCDIPRSDQSWSSLRPRSARSKHRSIATELRADASVGIAARPVAPAHGRDEVTPQALPSILPGSRVPRRRARRTAVGCLAARYPEESLTELAAMAGSRRGRGAAVRCHLDVAALARVGAHRYRAAARSGQGAFLANPPPRRIDPRRAGPEAPLEPRANQPLRLRVLGVLRLQVRPASSEPT
jgi:hypothetical protein